MKTRGAILYNIIFLLFLLEGILRLQQLFGPIYDLAMEEVSLDSLSDTLNHKPTASDSLYGYLGVKINQLQILPQDDKNTFKVLFMGDSFMQGLGDISVPQYILSYYQNKARNKNLLFLNAAYCSYSPSIFIPQAKKLIPLLKPDFTIVDIDGTDLGDDYIRYKDLTVRDDKGSIIAVKRTPINDLFLRGFVKIKRQSLYLTRLVSKTYHTRIYMPSAIKKYRQKDTRHVLSFLWDNRPDARLIYQREIAYFKLTVNDLIETLINLMGDTDKIMIIYHPHLHHLKPDKNGFFWNTFVSDVIEEVSDFYQVTFYNSTQDLKKAFGDNPQRYYITNDMHFNLEGLEIYSHLIADKLWQKNPGYFHRD